MFCPNCGISTTQNNRFCDNCGFELTLAKPDITPKIVGKISPNIIDEKSFEPTFGAEETETNGLPRLTLSGMPEAPRVQSAIMEKRKKHRKLLYIVIAVFVALAIAVSGMTLYFYCQKNDLKSSIVGIQTEFNKNNFEYCLDKLESLKSNRFYKKSSKALAIEGKSHMELGDYESAIIAFNDLLKIKNDEETYINLSVCYAKNGNSNMALKTLDNIFGRKDVGHFVKGEIHFKEKEYNTAEVLFENVISETKDDDLKRRSYLELAYIYKEQRHKDIETYFYLNKQIEVMEEAVRELKIEDDLTFTEMMAEAYFTAMKYDLSVQKFSRLLELGYEKPYIYNNIAIIHQQTGNLKQAENILVEMRSKYPEDVNCYIRLAFLYMDMEAQKSNEDRDYSKVYSNYELAKKYASSPNDSDLIQLENSVDELKRKGW